MLLFSSGRTSLVRSCLPLFQLQCEFQLHVQLPSSSLRRLAPVVPLTVPQLRHKHDNHGPPQGPQKKKSGSSQRWLARSQNDFYSRKARSLNLKSRAGFKLQEIHKKFGIFNTSILRGPLNVVDLGFAPGAWTQVAVSLCPPDSKILGVDILPCKPPKGASSIQANILSKRTHHLIYEYFVKNDVIMKNIKQRSTATMTPSDRAASGGEIEGEESSSESEQASESDTNNSTNKQQIVDVVLSDMYEPFPQSTGFWNNTTNSAYYRMANTTGLKVKDHLMSMDLCDAGLILAIEMLRPGGTYVCKYYTGPEDYLLEYRLRQVFGRVVRFKPEASRSESKECYFVCMNKKANVDKVKVFQ